MRYVNEKHQIKQQEKKASRFKKSQEGGSTFKMNEAHFICIFSYSVLNNKINDTCCPNVWSLSYFKLSEKGNFFFFNLDLYF